MTALPHRSRVRVIGLAALPVLLGVPLWAALAASRSSVLGHLEFIAGPAVNFGATWTIARRSGWPQPASRRLALASAVVTFVMPVLVILLVLVIFVVGCRGDRCFTY
ncbi:MAG: hypothetical protein ACXVRJ_02730 [Gaiellaceae bacterium]